MGDELPDAVVLSVYGPITHEDPYDQYEGPPGNLVELTVIENISAR